MRLSTVIRFSDVKHGDDLLNALASSGGFSTLTNLEMQLNLSRRSVYYVIKHVNAELRDHDLFEITNVHGAGYSLDKPTLNYLNKSINDTQTASTTDIKIPRKLNASYRRKLILFSLITDQIASLNSLSRLFSISKNTVINDIKLINQELRLTEQGIEIINTPKGKIINGSEYNQRRWIFENNETLFSSILGESYPRADHEFVVRQLSLLEKITGNSFADTSLKTLIPFIQWYLIRIKSPRYRLDSFKTPNSSLTYIWSQSLLGDCDINNSAESTYLSFIVNTQPLSHINVDTPLLSELIPIAKKIVLNFEGLARVDLLNDNSKIVNDLAQHLVSTYYRVTYSINYKNPLLSQIKSSYQQTFSFTKISIQPFVKFVHHPVSDDEVSLITTYFSGALHNVDLLNREQHTPSVMVVCSSGIGTSQLLLSSLSSYFSSVKFIGPFSTFQYENSDLTDVKLVISSVKIPVKNKDIPILVIPIIPTQTDWNSISDALERNNIIGSSKPTITAETLIDVISPYARIEDPKGLRQALKEYINQDIYRKVLKKTVLHDLYAKNNQFITTKHDWLSAIHVSLAPLIHKRIVTQQYEDAIINLTELHGPYMAVGNGVMLAHAKPNDGVKALGVNITLFKHPFYLAESNKLINLVIGLAPIDQHSHFEFLEILLKFIQDKKWINQLKNISCQEDFFKKLSESELIEA